MKLLSLVWTLAMLVPMLALAQVRDTLGGDGYGTDGAATYGAGWWWFWFVLLLVIVGLAIWWVTTTGGRRPTPGGPRGSAPRG